MKVLLSRSIKYVASKLAIGSLLLFSSLPKRFGYQVGALLGLAAYGCSSRRRAIARKNIEVCFPNLSGLAKRKLERLCFVDNGIGLIESSWVWFGSCERQNLKIDIRGADLLDRSAKVRKGVLLICPHYTTLELSAFIINSLLGSFVITYRPHQNAVFEAAISEGRSRYGDLVSVRKVKSIVSSLKAGKVVWFGPDQDMGPRGSVFADFFGRPACTVTTPARFARATQCEVVFCTIRRETGKYIVEFKPMSDRYPCTDEEINARELNAMIEQSIVRSPSQYMWMHRRFKTNPDGSRHGFYD